jgi:hypothetical protein
VEVPAVDLVAATLRRVAEQSARQLSGAPVGEVRLVVPAGSGPRWRTGLREAARRAGLGQPVLVDAPVAVAGYLLGRGLQLVVGTLLLVCDWGGGFTASVLRRGPYEFELLSTIKSADAGGVALDHALAEQLAAWSGVEPDGADLAWRAAARAGREALSSHAGVGLPVPSGPPVALTWALVQEVLRPKVKEAADTVRAAIEAAEVPAQQLAGLFCVGGVAQSAQLVDMLARESGLPVAAIADPQRAALLGAARVTGPSVDASGPSAAEPPIPGWRQALTAAIVPFVASFGLLFDFVATTHVDRVAGIGYDPNAYLLANWGELALAAAFALVASLACAVVIAGLLPLRDPLSRPDTELGYGQQLGAGLLAACGVGLSAAGLYGIFGAVATHWSTAPFLRWALLPILPLAAAAALTAWLATRWGRVPAGSWHDWLDFPVGSAFVAAVGMVLVQEALTVPRYPADEPVIDLVGRLGGILIALATVMVLVRRWRYRLIVAAPLAVVEAGIVAASSTGILAVVYIAAATGWWLRRAWQLANHPRGALPRPA